MTECEQKGRMGALHDGEAVGQERDRLLEHAGQCAECAAELERLRAISRFMASADVPAASPAAWERWHGAVDAAAERTIFRLSRDFAAAAAVLLVVSLAWLARADGSSAGRGASAADWERAAVLRQTESSALLSQEARAAQWILDGLSPENDRD